MRLSERGLPWWWTVGPALGLGSIALGIPFTLGLQQGGLAPVATTALVAAILVAPLAREDWLNQEFSSTTEQMEQALSHLAILGSLASVGSTFAHELRDIALLATVAILAASVGSMVVWVGIAGWLLMIALGLLTCGVTPGWSVLEPTVASWQTWLAPAMTAGAFLGGVPGGWRWFPAPAPGRANVPFMVTGLLVVGLLAVSQHMAALHEATLGQPLSTVGGLVLVMAGTTTWMQRPGTRVEHALDLAVFVGLLATFTIDELPMLWWTLTCPVLIGAYAALSAWRTRSIGWFLFAVGLLASVLITSSTPPTARIGALVVLPWIASVWIGGTRTLLTRT